MPLFLRKDLPSTTSLILWEIQESESELLHNIILHVSDIQKFKNFTNEKKRKEFLALRACLKVYFGENPPVYYTSEGKPYLQNGYFISFSHTAGFAGMIVSQSKRVGIDLELFRERIKRIAHRFMRDVETQTIQASTEIPHLTHYWGAKEVMVKITGDRRLNFKDELLVKPFPYNKFQTCEGQILTKDYCKRIALFFENIDNLYITYGWEIS